MQVRLSPKGKLKQLFTGKKVEVELVQQLKENKHIREEFQKTWKIFMTFAIKGGGVKGS